MSETQEPTGVVYYVSVYQWIICPPQEQTYCPWQQTKTDEASETESFQQFSLWDLILYKESFN